MWKRRGGEAKIEDYYWWGRPAGKLILMCELGKCGMEQPFYFNFRGHVVASIFLQAALLPVGWLVVHQATHKIPLIPPFSLCAVLLQDNKMKIYCRHRHAATAATKSTQHCRCPKKGYERRLGNFFVGRSSPPKPSPTFLCYETEIIADFFHFGRQPRPNKNKNILCSMTCGELFGFCLSGAIVR